MAVQIGGKVEQNGWWWSGICFKSYFQTFSNGRKGFLKYGQKEVSVVAVLLQLLVRRDLLRGGNTIGDSLGAKLEHKKRIRRSVK